MQLFVYVISDNNYFFNGVREYIDREIYKNFDCNINYESYASFNLFFQGYTLNNARCSARHVVIARREFVILFNMMILSGKIDDSTFLAIEDCTPGKLRAFLKNTENHTDIQRRRISTFTLREAIICHHLAQSVSAFDIGVLMGISGKSVSAIRIKIMRKTGCDNKISLHRALMVWKLMSGDITGLHPNINF